MKPVLPASPRFPAPSWPLCENMPRRRLRQAAHTTPLCVLCTEGKVFVQHSRSDNITMEKTRSPLWTDVFFPFFCPCDIRLHVTLWVCTVTTVVMSCLHIRPFPQQWGQKRQTFQNLTKKMSLYLQDNVLVPVFRCLLRWTKTCLF